jgi:hypothetical protein
MVDPNGAPEPRTELGRKLRAAVEEHRRDWDRAAPAFARALDPTDVSLLVGRSGLRLLPARDRGAAAGPKRTHVDDRLEKLTELGDLHHGAIAGHGERLDALEADVRALRERLNARDAIRRAAG